MRRSHLLAYGLLVAATACGGPKLPETLAEMPNLDTSRVLADITRILADQQISIDAMIQREPVEGEEQTDIIILTHQTREMNIDAAIVKIEALTAVKGKLTRLRLEELL